MTRKLRLAANNRAPKPNSGLESEVFATLEYASTADAVRTLRFFGAKALPDNPTQPQLAEAWLQARPLIRKYQDTTGESTIEGVVAKVEEWKAAHEEVQRLTAENKALKQAAEARELESLITAARAEAKMTPAEAATFREQFAAGELTLSGAVAMLAGKTPHAVLLGCRNRLHAASTAKESRTLTHNGKTWDQLKPVERAALKREDSDQYAAMRGEYLRLHPELGS